MEEAALGFDSVGIRGKHQAVFLDHQSIGLPGAGEDGVAILRGHNFGGGVLVESSGGAFSQHEGDTQFFELSAVGVGASGGDVALIAIENRKFDGEFGDTLPAECLGG